METDFFEWFDSLEKAIGEAKACKNLDCEFSENIEKKGTVNETGNHVP